MKQIAKKETNGGMFDIDDKSSIGNSSSIVGEKNNYQQIMNIIGDDMLA